jgi:hypothetical protein
LYDDFTRLAQIDPAGYRANIDAWRQALLAAAQAGVLRGGSRFVVETGDALLRDLDTRQFGRPQGLARVLVRGTLFRLFSLSLPFSVARADFARVRRMRCAGAT